MGHLLKTKCVDSRVNVHILASTSVPITLTTVQVPNLALTPKKRITVYWGLQGYILDKTKCYYCTPLCALFYTQNSRIFLIKYSLHAFTEKFLFFSLGCGVWRRCSLSRETTAASHSGSALCPGHNMFRQHGFRPFTDFFSKFQRLDGDIVRSTNQISTV
jgi:hypothetical protein